MVKDLYFDYSDTSKIRFKIENVLENDKGMLWVRTEKLSFYIPRKICLVTERYVMVPLSFYRDVLNKFYQKILI